MSHGRSGFGDRQIIPDPTSAYWQNGSANSKKSSATLLFGLKLSTVSCILHYPDPHSDPNRKCWIFGSRILSMLIRNPGFHGNTLKPSPRPFMFKKELIKNLYFMIIRKILVRIVLNKTWYRSAVSKKESKSRIVYCVRTYYLWSDYRYGFGSARDKRLSDWTRLIIDCIYESTGTVQPILVPYPLHSSLGQFFILANKWNNSPKCKQSYLNISKVFTSLAQKEIPITSVTQISAS